MTNHASTYRLLQQKIKPYKLGGYTSIVLNLSKQILEAEYYKLLSLGFTQDHLERAIANRENEKIQNMTYWRVVKQPSFYSLRLIKTKIFQLSNTENTKELILTYPQLQDKKLDLRYKSSWIEYLRIIEKISGNRHEQQKFFEMVKCAIEIEVKCQQDNFFRHQTSAPDLLTLLRDRHLIGRMWEKEKSVTKELQRAFVIQQCKKHNLNLEDFYLN